MKMKVLFAIDRDVLWFIVTMESYMQKNQGPNSKDEKIISILSPFQDSKADIVAYKCKVSYRKESPRFHWIIGRLNAKESRT